MDMNTSNHKEGRLDDDDEFPLPGFRFHPTDEELVGFYLLRKIGKKPIGIEIIKQIDIYKYDPWDLTKFNSIIGEKECFFFCKRGRKYKNSIRPNRVTGSGFWKATGIDKPVYSNAGEGQDCIGFKKTLVYYRGSAGKGTKTDWMMHEFRLPSYRCDPANLSNKNIIASDLQFAEIWTLCRILKRKSLRKSYLNHCKQLPDKHSNGKSSKSACITVDSSRKEEYIVFGTDSQNEYVWDKKPVISYCDRRNDQFSAAENVNLSLTTMQPQLAATFSSDSGIWMNQNNAGGGFFPYDENWGDFGSALEFDQHGSSFHVHNY